MKKLDHNSASSATMSGIFDLFRKRTPIGTLDRNDRIDGKTCLVTGSSSGLGKAAAAALAARGGNVLMAARSKIPEAGEEVKRKSGSENVEMARLDLCSFSSVRAFREEARERKLRFDIAVFNAGVVPGRDRPTEDGFEEMLQVNYLAKFLLVNRLLEDGSILPGGRIIFTSSEAHRSPGQVDFSRVGEYHAYGMKGSMAEYGYTKLLLTTFFHELVRRRPDISIFALCPGPVNTKIAREAPKLIQPLLKLFFAVFFRSPKKAAEPIVYLACSPDMEGKTETYIHLMEEKETSPESADPKNGAVLWEKSARLIEKAKSGGSSSG